MFHARSGSYFKIQTQYGSFLPNKTEADIHLPTDCMISSNNGAAKSGLKWMKVERTTMASPRVSSSYSSRMAPQSWHLQRKQRGAFHKSRQWFQDIKSTHSHLGWVLEKSPKGGQWSHSNKKQVTQMPPSPQTENQQPWQRPGRFLCSLKTHKRLACSWITAPFTMSANWTQFEASGQGIFCTWNYFWG